MMIHNWVACSYFTGLILKQAIKQQSKPLFVLLYRDRRTLACTEMNSWATFTLVEILCLFSWLADRWLPWLLIKLTVCLSPVMISANPETRWTTKASRRACASSNEPKKEGSCTFLWKLRGAQHSLRTSFIGARRHSCFVDVVEGWVGVFCCFYESQIRRGCVFFGVGWSFVLLESIQYVWRSSRSGGVVVQGWDLRVLLL